MTVNNKLPEQEAQDRRYLRTDMWVDIVLKQDQKTMTLTRGKIKDFLTPNEYHPRGVKVRLHKDGIERLYNTSPLSKKYDVDYSLPYKDENFIGRVQRIYYPNHYGILFVDKNGEQISEELLQLFAKKYKENTVILLEGDKLTNDVIHFIRNINHSDIDLIILSQSISQFLIIEKELQEYFHGKNAKQYLLNNNRFTII